MRQTEFRCQINGLTTIYGSAREAQKHAREILENRDDVSVAYADGTGGYWEFRKSNGKVTRTKNTGNLL